MITISNIRKEPYGEWVKLVCDIKVTEIENPFKEDTMWFAVKKENEEMFGLDTYDAFFLVPLYLAMFYKTDLKIEGKVSKTLYRNMMEYGQTIMKNFSPDLEKVNVIVDGFGESKGEHNLIGTGISCGIDSLSVIYDKFEIEKDPEYKINSLFLFNCGTHGHYEVESTYKKFLSRSASNKIAADDMGLPTYLIDSNLHSFTHTIAEQKLGYLAIYSCVLSVQKSIKKYYMASSYSYDDILEFHNQSHDFDFAEYTESYFVPLVKTEKMKFVLHGCQWKRSEKTELIADWDIAKKYLNVCITPVDSFKNCSKCSKCMRTLIALETMGKLDEFSDVFNLEVYKKYSRKSKIEMLADYKKEGFATDNVDFAREHGLKLPCKASVGWFKLKRSVKRMVKKTVGGNAYERLVAVLRKPKKAK